MKVMVFGATGAVGRPAGADAPRPRPQVLGTTRAAGRAERCCGPRRRAGRLRRARRRRGPPRVVAEHRPDAIVNQLTALGGAVQPAPLPRVDRADEPAPHARAPAISPTPPQEAGIERFVSQSIAFAYRWDGDGLKTEDDPLFDRDLGFAEAVHALRELERLTLAHPPSGVVLRYGWFYGPGTRYARDGDFAAVVSPAAFRSSAAATGVFSFIHVEDAARATVAALDVRRDRRVQRRRRRPGADARLAARLRAGARRPAAAGGSRSGRPPGAVALCRRQRGATFAAPPTPAPGGARLDAALAELARRVRQASLPSRVDRAVRCGHGSPQRDPRLRHRA